MRGDATFVGLTPGRQLVLIAIVGFALVVASYWVGSPIDAARNPTLFAIGVVCLLYALLQGGYEVVR